MSAAPTSKTKDAACPLRLVEGVPLGPAPVVHPETEPFWSVLAEGRFLIQRCSVCATWRFPLAPLCHVCLAFDHDWVELAAAGTVAVAVIVRRATGIAIWRAAVPFTTGLVEMEHDIRLPGRILCSCAEAPRPGSAVTLCRIRTEGGGIVHAFEHHCQSALEEAE